MPQNDPYAAYGGKVADDPYKAYGGSVSQQLGTTPESMGIANPIPVSQGVPPNLRGPVTMADRIRSGDAGALPGSFEGKPENVGQYVPNGPGQLLMGAKDVLSGKFARGTHKIISGAGATALPATAIIAPQAMLAAPAATALGVGGSAAGSYVAGKGAEALGATPDQSAVASDLGGMAGGFGALKAKDLLTSAASRALLLGKTPQGAYESALKPSTTIPAADRAAIVDTGLREGIPVSQGGVNKLSSLIDDVNSKITAEVNSRPDVLIDPKAVAQRMKPTQARFAEQVNPDEDLTAIAASKAQFLNKHTDSAPYTKIVPTADGESFLPVGSGVNKVPRPLTAPEAQAEKVGTYRVLGDKSYGELKSASVEAQKSLARGLKEEIAQQFPEISKLNEREGSMLELQDVLERAVSRIGNHQLLGIGTPVAAGAAKAVTGSNKIAAVAGVVKGVLDNPAVKSRLAIALIHAGVSPDDAVQRLNQYAGVLAQASARGSAQPDGSPPSQ